MYTKCVRVFPIRLLRTTPLFKKEMSSPSSSSDTEDSVVSAAKKPKFTVVDVDGWQKRWTERKIGFHQEAVHPYWEKYMDNILDNRENTNIFFPLCGKSVDIKWLSDKGHNVVGVECSAMALEEFFEEQKVEYTKETAEEVKGSLFQSKDGKIKLYCCDIYDFNKDVAGQFDVIWDRASLVAINRSDRVKYTDLLKGLMKPECCLALVTLEYDETKYAGPPHNVSEDQVMELYDKTHSVKLVETLDGLKERHKNWGISALEEKLYLIRKI
ncbi:probable thiopurine S-methyltransferase [Ylistrum balloti]|uniref:probable thiopurine S-methyltransferase n=1 Tax=Ylistrum balloti TaxID=509963 RepID=UPI002905E13B|nr:probable thiopurine S-methyltransferase [Ylistrum balloti]